MIHINIIHKLISQHYQLRATNPACFPAVPGLLDVDNLNYVCSASQDVESLDSAIQEQAGQGELRNGQDCSS